MGLLDLFRSKDPSDDWPPAGQFTPRLDLREHAVCGVPLGADPGKLERLGKPDNRRPFKDCGFTYSQSGTWIAIEEGRIAYVTVTLGEDPLDDLQPARAALARTDGAAVTVDGSTTLADLKEFLQLNPTTEEDEDEIVHTFTIGRYVLEAEAEPDGRLKRLNYFCE